MEEVEYVDIVLRALERRRGCGIDWKNMVVVGECGLFVCVVRRESWTKWYNESLW